MKIKSKKLTHNERMVFSVFERNSGETLSREDIFRRSFPDKRFDGLTNIVDVYIWSIRMKLGADTIRTVRGLGYMHPGRGSGSYYGA